MPWVPTTVPSRTTTSSSIQSDGRQEAQRDQWYCIVLRARSSGDASVQATMNGCTSGSCTPTAARSASAPRSSRLGQRSSRSGVCSRRSASGQCEDNMAAIVPRPARSGHPDYHAGQGRPPDGGDEMSSGVAGNPGEPAQVIPESLADLVERPLYAHLATVRPDGTPQVNPTWFRFDGEYLWL